MSRHLVFFSAALIAIYYLTLGATYPGMLRPDLRLFSVALLAAIALAWLLSRRGRPWHPSPLDLAILLWLAAFAISIIANLETWRRTLIAFWFMGLYIGTWYALNDWLVHRKLPRRALVDALLMANLIILIFGFLQIRAWLQFELPDVLSGRLPFSLPRPVSTLGNPNLLAGVLVPLIPVTLAHALTAPRRIAKAVLLVYSALASLLLILTFSRGAWLGLVAALGLQAVLTLHAFGLLSASFWRAWYAGRSPSLRLAVGGGIFAAAVLIVVAVVLFGQTFTLPGRSAGFRGEIYATAIELFQEQPLAGQGLFTFGQHLSRILSTPPNQTHSHAHNLPLQVAAELGLPGLIALAATALLATRALIQNWRQTGRADRVALAGAAGGVAGFAVHHLFDVPAMVPAVALVGLAVLALAAAPVRPAGEGALWPARVQRLAVPVLWVALLVTGLWSTLIYRQYTDALVYGATSGDYTGAAARLQPIIDADPALAVYHGQQGMFLSLAADAGDDTASIRAVQAYERYTALEPYYAMGWANLAGLYWHRGEREQAVEAQREAVRLAPQSPSLVFRLGLYTEQAGQVDRAREAYQQAILITPDITLLSAWGQTPLQRELSPEQQHTDLGRFLLAVTGRDAEAARQVFDTIRPNPDESRYRTWMALMEIAQGNLEAAARRLEEAEVLVASSQEAHWLRAARAWLAVTQGNAALARQLLTEDPLAADYSEGANIAYIQFVRQAIPRQFVPQASYIDEPAQRFLVEQALAALERLPQDSTDR